MVPQRARDLLARFRQPGSRASRAVLVIAMLLVTACAPDLVNKPTQSLEATFPTLAGLGVDALWTDDACRYFAYERGVFSADPSSELCAVDGLGPGRAFDAEANRDLEAVVASFSQHGLPIVYASVERDATGNVGAGSFFNPNDCESYTYDPRWDALPADLVFEEAVPLNEDWYLIAAC